MAKCVSPDSAGVYRWKGGGWPPQKAELVISKSPKMRNRFPRPGDAADRARGHISGLSTGGGLGGWGRRKRGGGVQALVTSSKSGFSVLCAILSRKEEVHWDGRVGWRARNKSPIDLMSCPQRCKSSSGKSSTEAQGGSPGRQREKNTVSDSGTFPIDYASSRQRDLKGSQITQPKLEKIQPDICPSDK